MKRFLTWTATILGITVGGTLIFRAVQSGRERLKNALGEVEAVADRARATLEQTQSTLHSARKAL
jgi:hypothetical protein